MKPSPAASTALVMASLFSQQGGAALAVLVFPAAGPLGVVALRLVFSAALLVAVARPALRSLDRRQWTAAAGLGLALAGMNAAIYGAIDRIPLGVAVTIEALGPLVLSVVAGRRAAGLAWAGLALAGILLLGRDGFGGAADGLDPLGVLLALAAAACWAAYILANQRAGSLFPGVSGLTLAMAIGSVAVLPAAIGSAGAALLDPVVLAVGLGVALLSSAVPYALEMQALRRLRASTFAIVVCLSPVAAAVAGLVVLGQALGWVDVLGMALVVGAGIGAVRMEARPRP